MTVIFQYDYSVQIVYIVYSFQCNCSTHSPTVTLSKVPFPLVDTRNPSHHPTRVPTPLPTIIPEYPSFYPILTLPVTPIVTLSKVPVTLFSTLPGYPSSYLTTLRPNSIPVTLSRHPLPVPLTGHPTKVPSTVPCFACPYQVTVTLFSTLPGYPSFYLTTLRPNPVPVTLCRHPLPVPLTGHPTKVPSTTLVPVTLPGYPSSYPLYPAPYPNIHHTRRVSFSFYTQIPVRGGRGGKSKRKEMKGGREDRRSRRVGVYWKGKVKEWIGTRVHEG
ncbi:hypothetical protein M8J76_001093 [Diaphorina citri]|nr:hypothetical protein M8J76_001093 [Diaphorina citri]